MPKSTLSQKPRKPAPRAVLVVEDGADPFGLPPLPPAPSSPGEPDQPAPGQGVGERP